MLILTAEYLIVPAANYGIQKAKITIKMLDELDFFYMFTAILAQLSK
jgi:hypothetical protein